MARTSKGAAASGDPLSVLETRLNWQFNDRNLLERALMHSSAVEKVHNSRKKINNEASNERFEFLGDRVLGLVVAELLIRTFPHAEEGELALRLNALVREEACAEIAERIGLGTHLVLSLSEDRTGGREKSAILGDACEALIAAMYLDGGLEHARRFIEAEWAHLVTGEATGRPDAKTALQEWTQKKGNGIPRYKVIERTGPDHAPCFEVEVRVNGMEPTQGKGASKRQAEQVAARAMLIHEAIWSEND